MAEAPTVCAKVAPLYNGLLKASHLQMVPAFYLSPSLPIPVHTVQLCFSQHCLMVQLGLLLQQAPEFHPDLRALPAHSKK